MQQVGVVSFWHETNTYSQRIPTMAAFADFELLSGDEVRRHHQGTRSVVGGLLAVKDLDVVPVFAAGAWPAGPAESETAEELLARLGEQLTAAGPLDGLLINLHGAMVAGGHPDMERDVVLAARHVIGDVPVAAVLDLHGNPSPEFVELCQVVIGYDTYPHVDMWERGNEAALLLRQMLRGRRLRTVVGKVPLLTCPLAQGTSNEPMASLLKTARKWADEAGVARVSLLPGFSYSDVDRAGFSVLVTADDDQTAAGVGLAGRICAEVETRRDQFMIRRDDAATAVRRALGHATGPVVLADVADNIGAGGPGDGTELLAELLTQGASGAVVLITDGAVARMAAELGVGGELEARVGAKTDDLHGRPVAIRGRVERITDGWYETGGSWMTGQRFCMGVTAVIGLDGVTLVVMERATPPFHIEQLTSVGIDPREAAVICVKGAIAWRAAYGDIAALAIEVATSGVCPVDVELLRRTSAPMRHNAAPAR